MAAAARRHFLDAASSIPRTGGADLPPPSPRPRYRVEVFGVARTPWRTSFTDAMADAIALDLATWDAEAGEHFLAVPVDMKVEIVTGEYRCAR